MKSRAWLLLLCDVLPIEKGEAVEWLMKSDNETLGENKETIIIGALSIINSTDPEADRAFLRDVLKFPYVDVGDGWLIFGLPPAELAVHPSDENDRHEFFLMCDDIHEFIDEMKKQEIRCSRIDRQSYGLITFLTLPGGGIYESTNHITLARFR